MNRAGSVGRRKVLAFAYACDPYLGSEPGAGWGVVRAIAAHADCVALVGPEHAEHCEAWLREHRDAGITIEIVPEPRWAARLPRTRIGRFLVYLAWLPAAATHARRLGLRQFDCAWHVTFSAYWLPSPAVDLGLPCVWGPVGGAVTTPRALWPALGPIGMLTELTDYLAVRLMAAYPPTRRTWRRVSRAIVQNQETQMQLPASLRRRSVVLNHALLTEPPPASPGVREQVVVFAGALESRKGPSLVVRALAHAPEPVRVLMIGDGPERHRLERLALVLGVAHRITFTGRQPREMVFRAWRTAGAAVFTGLREEGGISLAEAMLCGTPVIVLANGGARTIAMATTDRERVALIEPSSIDAVVRDIATAMTRLLRGPQGDGGPLLNQISATARVGEILEEVWVRC